MRVLDQWDTCNVCMHGVHQVDSDITAALVGLFEQCKCSNNVSVSISPVPPSYCSSYHIFNSRMAHIPFMMIALADFQDKHI